MPILTRLLRQSGLVSEEQIEEAIQHQVLYGGRLGTSLHELGFVTEEGLTQTLARAHGVPAGAVDPREIQPETVALLSRAMAARHKVFPYRLRGKTLFLLMVDPQDHSAVARVSMSLGLIVKPLVVAEFRMVQLLRDHYGIDERWRFDDTQRAAAGEVPAPTPAEAAARIDEAWTRDAVVQGLVALCRGFFERVIFFIVREPWIVGWTGSGDGMERAAAGARIPLDRPSAFRQVVRDRAVFLGPLGVEEEDRRFLKAIAKRPGTTAAVFPIVLRGRAVNLVYGDGGPAANVRTDLGELIARVQKVPRAYLRIIRKRIAEARRLASAAAREEAE